MSQQSESNNHTTAEIGDTLRQAREAKGLSIASAAMHTNLRKDIIEKLENDQFGDIGAPVFTRGYLNIYARFLEVDEELVTREFSSKAQPKGEQSLRINSANIESQGKPYKRSMARGWISLLLVLLIGGALIAQLLDDQSWLLKQIRGTFSDSAVETSETHSLDDSTGENVSEEPEFTVEVADNTTQTNMPSLTSVDGIAANEVDRNEGTGETSLSLSSLDNELSSNDASPQTANQSDPEPVQTDPVPVGKASLQTSEENWIEVRDANGQIVSSKIYPAGANIELAAEGSPYRLNIGRPNAITLTVNGENKSLADYRNKGQTRLFSLSIPNE